MKSLCLGYGVIVSYEFKLAHLEDVFAEFVVFSTTPYSRVEKGLTLKSVIIDHIGRMLDHLCNILEVDTGLSDVEELHIGWVGV